MTKHLTFISIFFSFISWAQPNNDDCSNASYLCFDQPLNGTTENAGIQSCLGTNVNGCADDIPSSVGFTPSASVWYQFTTNTTGGDVTISINNLTFNADPTYGQALQAAVFQVTTPCEGQSYTTVSNVELNGSTDFTLTATALAASTTYYVLINGSNSGTGVTQSAEASFDISIDGLGVKTTYPQVDLSVGETDLCQGDVAIVTVNSNQCNSSFRYEWYYNGTYMHDSTGFDTGVLSESGDLEVVLFCGENCIYTDTSDAISFNVTPIWVDAGEDFTIEKGESVTLNGSGSGTPLWTPETYLDNPTTYTPLSTPEQTTTYFLSVNNNGCTVTDEMKVSIKESVIIPNGFSPNDDGVNDFFEVVYIGQYPDNTVKIFDRSGQIIFKTTGYNNSTNYWDGTYNGKKLPTGTYFYVIDLRNSSEQSVYKGYITLF